MISYSLYLWHWPLIVYANLFNVGGESENLKYIALAFSFLIAVFSWHYIEKPFRSNNKFSSKKVILVFLGATIILATISIYGISSNGLPSRFSLLEQKYFKSESYRMFETSGIYGNKCHDQRGLTDCILKKSESESESESFGMYGLVGDSFSGQLSLAFIKMLEKEQISGLQLTDGGCPFISGFEFNKKRNWSCLKVNNKFNTPKPLTTF